MLRVTVLGFVGKGKVCQLSNYSLSKQYLITTILCEFIILTITLVDMSEEKEVNWVKPEEHNLEIPRTFTHSRNKTLKMIVFIVKEIRLWQQKEVFTLEDDKEAEKRLYWVADFLVRDHYPLRIDTIKNQLWGVRDRYHNDKLA